MSEDKETKSTTNSRRKALKAIGAGGVLAGTIPGSWTKPIVKSVLLPAHAQTSVSPVCGSGGPCTPGMGVNIINAVVTGGGDLFVLGDSQVPIGGGCFPGNSQSIICDIIDNGVVIGSDSRTSAGNSGCDTPSIGGGCLVSCSVVVPANNNTLASGDCVTLRMTFNGTCVCSGVTTVA